jgi:hypothetical protein
LPARVVAGAAASPPTRSDSAASPRSFFRCLQLRRSGEADWLRHAGQLHEYTPPLFLST